MKHDKTEGEKAFFRLEDSQHLTHLIKSGHSVEMIGMKRVGISYFLRLFLQGFNTLKNENQLLISFDLNDLVTRTLFSFWVVTFKRLSDTLISATNLPAKDKKKIAKLFTASIQSQDILWLYEGIRETLKVAKTNNLFLTIFFIRFDRLQEVINEEFLLNLESLRRENDQLSYVFTSFRPLKEIIPSLNPKQTLPALTQMFIKPQNEKGTQLLLKNNLSSQKNEYSHSDLKLLHSLSGGHLQYLEFLLILMREKNLPHAPKDTKILLADERISLLSEEIWESLTHDEKNFLLKSIKKQNNTLPKEASYLAKTGILTQKNEFFNPLFAGFVKQKQKGDDQKEEKIELTRKEHKLFTFLKSKLEETCERDEIIQAVWPESSALGVSDWTIDRLTARLRAKLKKQKSEYTLTTVKTRGYRLQKETSGS